MIDRDLAELYQVKTKALNQAVRRNLSRFPAGFMFRLNRSERNELVTNCDRFDLLKYASLSPMVFTDYGVAMLSSVLRSQRAVQINILIIRTFIRLRELALNHRELSEKLHHLEAKVHMHDSKIRDLFRAMKEMLTPKKSIGFNPTVNEK